MYNSVILVGRMAADPELKQTASGVSVTSFTVACDRRRNHQECDFIHVVAWRNQAEFVCKYFAKGSPIGVDGSIQTRSYTDRDGNKRIAFEVVAENVFFAGGKGGEAREETSGFPAAEDGDDLPF